MISEKGHFISPLVIGYIVTTLDDIVWQGGTAQGAIHRHLTRRRNCPIRSYARAEPMIWYHRALHSRTYELVAGGMGLPQLRQKLLPESISAPQ